MEDPEAAFEELDLLELVLELALEPALEEPPFTDVLSSSDDEAALPPEDDEAEAAASEELDESEAIWEPETPSSAFSAVSAEPVASSTCASEPF